jgi:hypothetical protein
MKTKQMLVLSLLLLGVSLSREAQAFYNPNAGRWLSRDPILEIAFDEFRNADAPRDEILPDLNEYQFVANRPMSFVDYLGGGIFCKCDFSVRYHMPAELKSSITFRNVGGTIESESDIGTYICSKDNQGATIKHTVKSMCTDRKFTWERVCGCNDKTCHVKKLFSCGTGTKGAKKDRTLWIFMSWSIVKDCY